MARNYDSTKQEVFTRILSIAFNYPSGGQPSLSWQEISSLADANGTAYQIADSVNSHSASIDLVANTPIQLYNPMTGAAVEGQTITPQALLTAIYSLVHAEQLTQDVAAG